MSIVRLGNIKPGEKSNIHYAHHIKYACCLLLRITRCLSEPRLLVACSFRSARLVDAASTAGVCYCLVSTPWTEYMCSCRQKDYNRCGRKPSFKVIRSRCRIVISLMLPAHSTAQAYRFTSTTKVGEGCRGLIITRRPRSLFS